MTGEEARILVVDDEKSIRDILERTLSGVGYEVVTAANGQEALDEMSETKIDVALLDIKMPGMSGIELLHKMTANRPEICVVMATSVADTQTAVEAMKLGAYDYITKPFDRDDVILKVQKAIEKKHVELQNESRQFELHKKVGEQTERLQQQFVDLVETLAREHKLIYKLAQHEGKAGKEALSRLPKELQEPMASVEEFSEALLNILRGGIRLPRTSREIDKGSKR